MTKTEANSAIRVYLTDMRSKYGKIPVLFVVSLLLLGFLAPLTGVFLYTRGGAYAATSNTLNFQGRLLGAGGTLVADGTYNIEFNLYNVSTGGSTQWTEDYINTGTPVTVKNGFFSVNLGSLTGFPSSINWDQQEWLGMTVRGTGSCAFAACTPTDAEMTPRFKLTAVPYAFQAGSALAVATDATNTASANSLDVSIASGNATGTTSNSGNINIDAGTATGTSGIISLGATNASAIALGRSGITTTVTGGLTQLTGAVSLTANAASSITTTAGSLTLTGAAASTFSTTAGNLTLQGGSGTVTLGTSTSLTASGALSVTSGGATTMSIDAGDAATLNLGILNANAVSISKTGITTTVNGGLTVVQATLLNGGLTVANTGNVAFQKAADISTTGNLNNLAVTGALVRLTGASTQTLTGLASGADGRILTIINAAGQAAMINNNDTVNSSVGNYIITGTGGPVTLPAGASVTFVYDATAAVWRASTVASSGGAGVNTVGAISGTSNANGATISGTTITLTPADATYGGVLTNGTQIITGAKTFNTGLTATGGAVSLTGNAASSLTTTSGALTLTGAVASTFSTTAGDLTLQGGSGTVSLGTSTTLTASGALSVTSGGANTLTVDAGGAATLNLGTGNANAVSISKIGVTTTINGGLSVTQGAAFAGSLTIATGNTFTNASSTLNTAIPLTNFNYTGSGNTGTFGSAATTVDVATSFTVNQTTAGQTLVLASPTGGASGRTIYVSNIGSQTFTIGGFTIAPNGTGQFVYNGSTWTLNGNVGGSGNFIQNQNSVDQASANFRIAGTGQATTSLLSPVLDALSGGTLSVGTANAASVTLGGTTNTTSILLQGNAAATYVIGTSGNTGGITLGNSTATNSINVGSAAGSGNTQTINIGTSATAGSATNVVVGSTIAGTVALQAPTSITNRTSGSADTFVVSNNTSTGNISVFKNNVTPVFTLAAGGAATFSNQTNSQTGFQIQNAAGTSLFTADTTTSRINISAQTEFTDNINSPFGGIGTIGNLLFDPENFATSNWISTNITSDTDGATAPDSTTNADTIITSASGTHTIVQTSVTGNNTYTFSIWLKASGGTVPITLRMDSSDGTPTTGTANSYTLDATWRRYSVTQTFTGATAHVSPTITIVNNTATIIAWGAQVQAGTSMGVYMTGQSLSINAMSGAAVDGTLRVGNSLFFGAGDSNGATSLSTGVLDTCSGCNFQIQTGVLSLYNDNGSTAAISLTSTSRTIAGAAVTGAAGNSLTVAGGAGNGGNNGGGLLTLQGGLAVGSGTGGGVIIAGGRGGTTGTGGALSLSGGQGGTTNSAGGAVTLQGGTANATTTGGVGGNVTIQGGTSTGTNANNGGALTLTGGTAATTGSGGTISITTGAGGTTSGNSGALTLQSGNVTSGTAGNVSVDIGSGNTSGTPAINLGNSTNSPVKTITIGGTTQTGTITLGQSTASNIINIGNANTATGNTQTINIGAGTPSGTGLTAITIGNILNGGSLNLQSGSGGINIGTGAATQNITLGNTTGGSLIVKSFNQTFGNAAGSGLFTNNGATVNATLVVNDDSNGGALGGTPAGGLANTASVDVYTSISINQTTAGQTITLPTPTASTVYGRILYVSNIGTTSFIIAGTTVNAGTSVTFIWSNSNGAASWQSAGAGGSGVTTIGAVSASPTANGGTITGTTLNLSVADGSNAGLISTTTQTIAGAKTFSGLVTGQLGATISGAAISLNDSSNFNTNINTGTSTGTTAIGNAASTTNILGATNINTTGTALTAIGNSGAVVTAVGSTINLNSATIATNQTTVALLNSTATTINAFSAATSLNLDDAATTKTINIGGVTNSGTDTINIATNAASPDTISIGSSNAASSSLLTGGASSLTLNNTSATLAGTTINLNAATILGSATTQNLFNTVATIINFGGAATSVNIGATTGTLTVKNANQTFGNAAGSGVFTNNGATVNTTLALSNFATGGSIGTAAATVDVYTSISINQTTTLQTITLTSPTASTTYGRTVNISNIGTTSFTIGTSLIMPGNSATFIWSNTNGGASWQYSGDGGGSGNYIQNQNTADQTANFRISGTGQATGGYLAPSIDAITGALSIGTTTATGVTIGNVANNSSLTLNSGTGAISIGTDANAKTVSVGSSTGTSVLNLFAGTGTPAGDLNLQTAAGGIINIGTSSVTNKILNLGTIGNIVQASTIHIADTIGNATQSVSIGSASSANNAVFIQGGTSATAIRLAAGAAGTITVGSQTAANSINIGTVGAAVFTSTIHIGDSTGATQNITIGSSTPTGTNTTINGGATGGVSIQVGSTGAISIGSSSASTVNVGTGAFAHTVNVANDATTAQTVSIGSTFAGSTLTLSAAGAISLNATGATFSTGATLLNVAQSAASTVGSVLTVAAGQGGTGTGYAGGQLNLQGGAAGGTNANGGNVLVSGGAGTGAGFQGIVNLSTTAFSSAPTQFFTTSGVTATTAGYVNLYSTLPITSNISGSIDTITDPGQNIVGRVIYVSALSGSSDMTLRLNASRTPINISLKANSTATLIWNGTDWTAAGASSSTDLQAAYNNTLSSAGGAEIVLNAAGGAADGLTIRNNATTPIIGAVLEAQTSIGSNLFSVNNNAAEYASNGGAETAGGTSTTFPSNTWSASATGGTTATVTRDTTAGEYATGQAAAKVVTTGATTAGQGASDQMSSALTPNLQYTVSFTAKANANFSTLDVVYSKDGTNSSATPCTTGQTVNQSTFARINCTFTAPSSGITSSNAIFIRQSDSNSAAQTFFIDNLSVTVNASVNHAVDGSVDSALGTNWVAVGGSVTRDTTNIYDTSGSISVTTGATNRGVYNNLAAGIIPQQSATGVQYRASFYLKANSGTVTINSSTPSIYYSPDSGTTKKACNDLSTTSISVASSWTLVSCIFTTDNTSPSGARFYMTNTSNTTFWVDALTITLNTNTANQVQIGGGSKGGPVTLFTLDRSAGAPIAANNDTYLGSMYYDTSTSSIQCYGSTGWGACGAAPDNIVNLTPEFPGAVLNGSGVGTMTADFCANQSGVLQVNQTLCDGTGTPAVVGGNFYKWTSPQSSLQTYSIYVSYQLPSTFKSFASDNTVQLTARVDDTSNAGVTYQMFKSEGGVLSQCGSGETDVITGGGGSANTWYTYGINGNEATGGCFSTASAGDTVIFKINVKASNNFNAYVAGLSFTTKGK